MTDMQLETAARLWLQGYDSHAIAKRVFDGWKSSFSRNGETVRCDYEATIYNNLRKIREMANAQINKAKP